MPSGDKNASASALRSDDAGSMKRRRGSLRNPITPGKKIMAGHPGHNLNSQVSEDYSSTRVDTMPGPGIKLKYTASDSTDG